MVITIEPGMFGTSKMTRICTSFKYVLLVHVYVSGNKEFLSGIYVPSSRSDVKRWYRGIGLRIEDNIVITESGHENLTRNCPKTLLDIENTCSS